MRQRGQIWKIQKGRLGLLAATYFTENSLKIIQNFMTLFLGAFFYPVTVANFLVPVFSLGASAKTSS